MLKRFHQLQDDEGFTLVELLIVIVILGILAGVVVFAVNGITDRGQLSACATDKNTLAVAQEAHYASDAGAYADEGDLVTAGFLSVPSKLYNTSATNGGKEFTITVDEANESECPLNPEP